MKIEEIKIEMCYNLGNYSTVKIGQVASVESNDNVDTCYRQVMRSIEDNFTTMFRKKEEQCDCQRLKVAQPVHVEQPKQVERPVQVEQPKRVEQPEQVEQPKRVEQPEQVEQPKQVERPVQVEQPVQDDRIILQRRNSLLWKKISVDFRNGKISMGDIEKKYFLNKEMLEELQTIQKEKNRVELDCSGSEVVEVSASGKGPFVEKIEADEKVEKIKEPEKKESTKVEQPKQEEQPKTNKQFVATGSQKFYNIIGAITERRVPLSVVYKYFEFDEEGNKKLEKEYKKAFQE